ncbi:Dihydrodipicolinate synthase [Sporothrix epigloea]|uniref:Dihydrodipicolinate synthase n=1 Tax=Sporothrix epigloea TaxID=1892477 RepID=A0ABP0DNZ2_9PEZI
MDYVEQRMTQEAQKQGAAEVDTVFLTPLNIILTVIVFYVLYMLFWPSKPVSYPQDPPAVVFRTYTPRTLLPFNGNGGYPVYLAVRGVVFDVSSGRQFYGPGGPYENFAGRDASRGLASHSFDEAMLTKNLDGPLDPLEDMTPDMLEALQGWEERFNSKYQVVGRLISVADFEKERKEKQDQA